MRKCVCGSPEAVDDEEEDDKGSCGVGGEARRAATVREAAVPLWTEHRCIVRRELRSPLGLRVGRTRLSMVVAMKRKCNWRVTNTELNPSRLIGSSRCFCKFSRQYYMNTRGLIVITRAQTEIVNYAQR
jgi:hypothetical protein